MWGWPNVGNGVMYVSWNMTPQCLCIPGQNTKQWQCCQTRNWVASLSKWEMACYSQHSIVYCEVKGNEVPERWNKGLLSLIFRKVLMSEVLLEVSQKIVILLVECSPKELVCCKNSYFPVLFFLRRVLLKLGVVGLILAQGINYQMRCLCK